MWPTLTLAAGIIASAYIFLRFLLYLTQDAREPPAILTALPFVGPLIGMIKENTNFQVRLRSVVCSEFGLFPRALIDE
jgi:hypothetical protein